MRTTKERFNAKYEVDPATGCWLWAAAQNQLGYGMFAYPGEQLAHRASYRMHFGPIPEGLFVCHHCDTPGCVNPAHLFTGTNTDNQQDSSRKGRTRNKNSGATHCIRGHAFDEENTYHTRIGTRSCRKCRAVLAREFRRRNPGRNARVTDQTRVRKP